MDFTDEKPALLGAHLLEGLQEAVDITFDHLTPVSIAYVIRNPADYARAVAKVDRYFQHEPQLGTPARMDFDALLKAIDEYEAKHWTFRPDYTPSSS